MECIKNLPNEIQHKIEGYTRNLQPKELMLDVRSFTTDFDIVENCYFMHYNDRILLYDLLEFCKKKVIVDYIKEIAIIKKLGPESYVNYLQYIKIESDNVIVTQLSKEMKEIKEKYKNREIRRRIRELWGLFSPTIRTKFINDYILIDEIEL